MSNASNGAVHYLRPDCRVCGSRTLVAFLSLGPSPLANAFLANPAEFATEAFYPLDVYFCETCGLVQLLDVISPEVLFRNYVYATGTSDSMAAHNAALAALVVKRLDLGAADLVVEVASNDGSLLTCFAAHGVRTLGIEPATNIAALAEARGIETVNRFFDARTADDVRALRGPAKAVIANNVLAHVDEPADFLAGCRALLGLDGLVLVEVPYLARLLDGLEYDTIYHEHLSYFSVSTLMRLCERVNLSLIQVDHLPVHGGSLRLYLAPRERYPEHASAVQDLAAAEQRAGLVSLPRFLEFARDVERQRDALVQLLHTLVRGGRSLAGYGAPAKGNTLLNYCGIDHHLLPYVVDKSDLKVGLYTPGTHIPVLPVSTVLDRQPDYLLILAWNFADEIMRQQSEYRRRGGRFLLPLPRPAAV